MKQLSRRAEKRLRTLTEWRVSEEEDTQISNVVHDLLREDAQLRALAEAEASAWDAEELLSAERDDRDDLRWGVFGSADDLATATKARAVEVHEEIRADYVAWREEQDGEPEEPPLHSDLFDDQEGSR